MISAPRTLFEEKDGADAPQTPLNLCFGVDILRLYPAKRTLWGSNPSRKMRRGQPLGLAYAYLEHPQQYYLKQTIYFSA
jgi:hypothetical protein